MKILDMFKNKKMRVIGIFVGIPLLILISVALTNQTQNTNDSTDTATFTTVPVSSKNTWNNISPGSSTLTEATKNLNEKFDENTYRGIAYRHYSSTPGSEAFPITIATNQEKIVVYVKRPVLEQKLGEVNNYINDLNLGTPDLKLYVKGEFNTSVLVFLDDGVALEGNDYNGSITYIRYFVPTTAQDFMLNWGKDLSIKYETPGH